MRIRKKRKDGVRQHYHVKGKPGMMRIHMSKLNSRYSYNTKDPQGRTNQEVVYKMLKERPDLYIYWSGLRKAGYLCLSEDTYISNGTYRCNIDIILPKADFQEIIKRGIIYKKGDTYYDRDMPIAGTFGDVYAEKHGITDESFNKSVQDKILTYERQLIQEGMKRAQFYANGKLIRPIPRFVHEQLMHH